MLCILKVSGVPEPSLPNSAACACQKERYLVRSGHVKVTFSEISSHFSSDYKSVGRGSTSFPNPSRIKLSNFGDVFLKVKALSQMQLQWEWYSHWVV